ncbi:hypothetical protein IEO21_09138 [Rhodonia placenta]|uniref:Uncharacterized protein n=1 Tax=Rhodonia placenta TaxID=104341 RepID=A0A8H7NVD1_9APHY|nr:hypothetical protein IEO21_09138 [Postia placenta]
MSPTYHLDPRVDHTNPQFPNAGLRSLSSLIHLLGVSILSFLFSRRFKLEYFTSLRSVVKTGLPRILVVITLVLSWAFLFTSGVLIFGAGLGRNNTVCSLAIINCIAFYTTSKIFIYLFLRKVLQPSYSDTTPTLIHVVEKIHVVWSASARARRFHSPIYITGFIFVCLYTVVAAVVIWQRVSFFRGDGTCVIGLRRPGSILLLAYDLSVNILFTSLFLWPLYRSTFRSARVRQVATRTVWAAAVALTTSCVNILILTLMKGRQLGWICLGSCGTDVVVNAVVLFWVTSGRRDSHSAEAPLPEELPTNPRERRSISLSLRKPPMIHQSSLLPTVPLKLGASSTASQHSSTSPSGCSPEREPHAVANTMMLTPLDEKAIVEEHERTSVEEAPRRGISGFFSSIFPRLGPTEEGSSSQDIQITVTTDYDVDDSISSTATSSISEPPV